MKIDINIDYDFISELYYRWFNERDVIVKNKLKEDIKRRISPHDFLKFSARSSFMPLKAFRKIFPLSDLFKVLEDMQKQGEDISIFTQDALHVNNPEDIQGINNFATRITSLNKNDFCFIFDGSMIFEFGDFRNIGKNFNNAYVNNLTLTQIEQMVKQKRNCKGIPITITIDNIGELPLEKLDTIEQCFDIDGIRILDKDKAKVGRSNQGESTPLNLNTYKKIRNIADEIIQKLYIEKTTNKTQIDFLLATQIIDSIAQRVEYDSEASKYSFGSTEMANASGMVGLLTGKAVCKGYAEILRNILSCVNIECSSIEGIATVNGKEEEHAWNQVKLGDNWFNVDLTFSRPDIVNGNYSGDLFMSDQAFFGDRRWHMFDKGRVVNGKNVESTVKIGGHSQRIFTSNHKSCGVFITPYITTRVMERFRNCDEIYRKDGQSPDYEGAVPYVGSSLEKMRSTEKEVETHTPLEQ